MARGGTARRVIAAAAAIAGLLASGCSGGSSGPTAGPSVAPAETPAGALATPTPSPSTSALRPPKMIGFGTYPEHRAGGFEATRLIRVDPKTLAKARGPSLRLRDAGTSWVFAPDRRRLAVGGVNFGELLLVDVAHWRFTTLGVARSGDFAPEVRPVAWPTSDRLIAYAEEFGAHELYPATLLVVDPDAHRVVTTMPLHASVLAAIRTDDGGAALLVCPVRRVGATRLVLVSPTGGIREVALDRIHGGYVDPGTPEDSMNRQPALVAHAGTVYAIGAEDPVAEVDVHRGTVRYHEVAGLMDRARPGANQPAGGSAGALSQLRRDAHWLGGGRILVTGDEAYPIRNGAYLHTFDRAANILDVDNWRVDAVLPTVGAQAEVVDGLIVANPYLRDRKVLRSDGTVLFRRPGQRFWTLVGSRLIEAGVNGRNAVELDLHTGRVIRRLPELAVWPLTVTPWRAPEGDTSPHEIGY